jgi:predicted NBD/HSP70 family sugar kinase
MITSSITATSTKADIIDASMEIIETQSEQITALQERQLVLLALVGVLSVLLLLKA